MLNVLLYSCRTAVHPAHVLQYKFIVDGEWKYDPNQPAMFDEMGNVNNVIEVSCVYWVWFWLFES